MTSKRNLVIGAGVALLAAAGVAAAAGMIGERDEVSERKIALSEVPQAAKDGVKSQLNEISKAELVKLKDGRTVYELKGKTPAGKTMELYVSDSGQVISPESEDKDDD